MDTKIYITPDELLDQSFALANMIWDDGFYPDFLVGLWRGGTPPGIAIQEFFAYKGMNVYHTAIKTQSYTGIMSSGPVSIKGIDHVIETINSEDNLLLVDDVFDSGKTMEAVVDTIKSKARKNAPTIRIAVVYYKPKHNESNLVPDYYVVENNSWLIFPHELQGLTKEEIYLKEPDVAKYLFED